MFPKILSSFPICLAIIVLSLTGGAIAGTSLNQKVGIAWPNGDSSYLANFVSNNTHYLYTWSATLPSNAIALGFEPVPMLWGISTVSSFTSLVVEGYANAVLGFNEPDNTAQSDLSPAEGASLWLEYIEPLSSEGYTLISPAVSNAATGLTWLEEFFELCTSCTIDVVALHYYGTTAADMIDYIEEFYSIFGRTIWVTEFVCQDPNTGAIPSQADVDSYMTDVVAFMESASYVQVYFAYGLTLGGTGGATQLINSDGTPTALGVQYLNPA